MSTGSPSQTLVIDSSALSVLVAWRHIRDSSRMPRKVRRDILADTFGGKLPPDSAFEGLWDIFVKPQSRIVTSNVLQEVWRASLPEKLRLSEYDFVRFAAKFQEDFELEEETVRFRELWNNEVFQPLVRTLGITDAGLVWIGQRRSARLLTEDADLIRYARAAGLEALGASSF